MFESGALHKCVNILDFENWINMVVNSLKNSFEAAVNEPSDVYYTGLKPYNLKFYSYT